jgi:Zn-finger nucleic acid-binding protein
MHFSLSLSIIYAIFIIDRPLNCPNCSAEMQLMQKYEVDIDYCPICKGVWLNRGEIDKIANIQNRYEDAHYQKYHYGQSDYDDYDTGYYGGRRKNRGFFGDLFYF